MPAHSHPVRPPPPAASIPSILLTAAVSFSLGILAHSFSVSRKAVTVPSPVHTVLPSLSPAQQSALPYPPDILPGSRDVPTPYGNIRVYEWGPTDGPKVLLIHGVSTPSLALGGIAHGLVEKKGCRVMLFDLFGRGYSDSPDDLPQDKRLFVTQILLVLASSPLPWITVAKDAATTSSKKFALVGFSLGGGISAAFTSYFPQLVGSLILLAPCGLIRPYRINKINRIIYSEVWPDWLLNIIAERRLRVGPSAARGTREVPQGGGGEKLLRDHRISQELPKSGGGSSFDTAPLSKSHPDLTVADAVRWQVETHKGFVRAFMSSIRYAPVVGQQEDWKRIGERLTKQRRQAEESMIDIQDVEGPDGLREGKVLIVAGNKDEAILESELFPDAKEVLEGNVVVKSVNGGHEFPLTKSEEVVEIISEFWKGD